MANTIQHKRGIGIPSSLAEGEFAVDTSNGDTFVGISSGVHAVSSFEPNIFGAELVSDFQLTVGSNAYVDVTGWTEIVTDSDFSFSESSGELSIQVTGLYKVGYNVTTDQYTGNNRSSTYSQLVVNGSLIKGTRQNMYNRQNTHGFSSGSVDRFISFTAGDVIKLQARNHDTSRGHNVLANNTYFRCERVR